MRANIKKRNELNEASELSNRLLLASLSAFIIGRPITVKLRGNKKQMEVMSRALIACKSLHEELHQPGTTLASVTDRMHNKAAAAAEFESVFGMAWPL